MIKKDQFLDGSPRSALFADYTILVNFLVVVWLSRISQIINDRRMWPSSTAFRELRQEVNAAIKAQATIRQDINPLSLEISRSINNRDISGLNKVISNKQVLLIRRNLDVVRTNNSLVRVGIIKTLDVVQIRDIEGCNVVAECEREISEFAVGRDVRVDSEVLTSTGAEIKKELGDTLLAVAVFAEGVDDPDLARADGGGKGRRLFVAGDELDVLDTLTIRNSDG